MNTKDEPGKGPAGSGGSRPHATLDLKATVVRPAGAEDEATSGPAVPERRKRSAGGCTARGARGR